MNLTQARRLALGGEAVAGLLLLLVANGHWIVPAATWLYPVFVIRFLRRETRRRYVAVYCAAIILVYCIAWRGLIQLSGLTYDIVASGIGIAFLTPFLFDRALAPRLQGVASTLVFPLAYAAVEFIGFRLSPYGTWGPWHTHSPVTCR